MKTIQLGCRRLIAAAVVAVAFAAKAETVVHYTFDDLGDVGTTLADSSTIQNKATPGTLDATVYGMNGKAKYASSVNRPYVTNGVPETLRVLDPVGRTIATSADKALRFPCTNAGGQGALLEIPNDSALRPSSFTVEMLVRLVAVYPNAGWQTIACQPFSSTENKYGWYIGLDNANCQTIVLRFVDTEGTERTCSISIGKVLLDYKWHHFAFTVEPNSADSSKTNIRFYIDYVGIYNYVPAPYSVVLSDSEDCPVQIGGTTTTTRNFMGEIGEFRFSSGALDPGEFLRPHNAAIDKDVVLYYDFEDTDAYDGNFAYSTNRASDVVNKASPIMPGAFQTAVGTDSKTYPFIDEASPGYRVLPSQNAESEKTMKSTHAFRNASYKVVGSNTSRLKCTPAYADIFRDTEDFTVEMFYKCGEKEYSDEAEAIAQQSKLFIVPGQFQIGFGNSTAQMIPILTTLTTSGSSYVYFSSGTRVDDGKWHHIAVVVKQSGDSKTFSWYHDGDLYKNQSITFSGSVSPMSSGAVWHIGTNNGGRAFDGWIDSLRVTLRALEPSEFLRKENQPGLTIIFK